MAAAAVAVGEGIDEDFRVLTLRSDAADGIEAAYAPQAGMVCSSLRHGGEELLGRRGGLSRYVERSSTIGIPFLHPWANRLGVERFAIEGVEVRLDGAGARPALDPSGLPIHGLLSAARGWEVERHAAEGDAAVLAARFDFAAHPDLLAAFPFPHEIRIEARLVGETLTIETSVRASGEVSVPVAFGYHPYFRIPGVDRAAWHVELPVRERLLLDERMLPTGGREPAGVTEGALGARTFDHAYVAPAGGAPFVVGGGGRSIEVEFGDGYDYAQVYASADDDVIAFEPMTSPTNALVADQDRVPRISPGDVFTARFAVRISDERKPA